MESKLIILLVVIIAAVAIAQLVRVYELSSKLRGKNEHEINQKDNNFNALLYHLAILLNKFFVVRTDYQNILYCFPNLKD